MPPTSSRPFTYESFPSAGVVAYFSMEIAINPGMPTYSGGLGVLAGDHLKAASGLGVPLIGVGLMYRQGYFRQQLFVYERGGAPCRVCGTAIRQVTQGQRSTYYCPSCQV